MLLSRIEAVMQGARAITLVSLGVAIDIRIARQADQSRPTRDATIPQSGAKIQHPEDIKAAIRKRHGSMTSFEVANGLPQGSVRDVLRGKASERIAIAIAKELGVSLIDVLRVTRPEVDRWICGGAENRFRFRKARAEAQR